MRGIPNKPQITFIFILILFVDSVNRVYRVQVELAAFAGADGQQRVYVLPTQISHEPP